MATRIQARLRSRSVAILTVLAAACLGTASLHADDSVRVVTELPRTGNAAQYLVNKAPLSPSASLKLPIGSITPKGWLHHQLQLEADGMMGHLEEISPWCKFEGNAWTDPKGQGKNGWEEVPYWLKGYGDLGYVLKDERITRDAKRWIDAIFAAQSKDGYFGPAEGRTSLNGKPDMWPHMPILNALQSYYDVTGDQRVISLMTRYFKWQLAVPDADFFTGYWDKMRTGDNMESVYWLYNHTGEKWLLDLASKLHKHAADWEHKVPNWHNVNLAEGFREPAEYSIQSGDAADYKATLNVYDTVMGTYGQVPGGGFGGDENCRPGYVGPRQGFETCGMVEFMHSFEMLGKISGDPLWADRNEEVAFNDFPAAMTPDLKALHYLTAPNQVQLDKENKSPGIQNGGTMFSYSPNGVYRCCQHNHGMGWPYYSEELWHATTDGGLEADLYAANEVNAKVAGGATVKIEQTTDYPFSDTVELKLSMMKPATFPLYLRVPRWCEKATIAINGKDQPVESKPLSYIAINRAWADGDIVTLKLPMHLAVRTWTKNGNSVSVDYGPLTFSLDIGEKWTRYGGSSEWPEQEVYPTTPWNYGLVLDPSNPVASFEVIKKPGPLADQPFTPETTPIRIKARARKIENWSVDSRNLIRPLQAGPIKSDAPTENVTLIPMGAARLRISSFPVIGAGPDAHEWPAPVKAKGMYGQAKATASHVFGGDSLDALHDGEVPSASNDQGVPRFTWWDHKGSTEWIQYDFKDPQTVSKAEVYWFDDTGIGQCRLPASWKLLYRDGNDWKPVSGASEFGVKPDTFNTTRFDAVKTTAVRVEVQLQPGFSGGVLEWKVE